MNKPDQKEPELAYPMRINRYLALQGHSTRRGADTLVEQKKVTINGRIAVLGDKVSKEDKVEIQNAGRFAQPCMQLWEIDWRPHAT